MNPILFPILAALAYGLYSVSVKLASGHVSNQILGAMTISFFAVLWGGVILLSASSNVASKPMDMRGLLLLCAAGFGAFITEYFVFQGYTRGLSLSIIQPITFGGGIALAVIVGLFLGESITVVKAVGILSIMVGMTLLLTQH